MQPRQHALGVRERGRVPRRSRVQWYARIQKQSKWKTLSGSPRSAMPSTNDITVASSYCVVNDVDSHSPYDQAGTCAGRPVSAV